MVQEENDSFSWERIHGWMDGWMGALDTFDEEVSGVGKEEGCD